MNKREMECYKRKMNQLRVLGLSSDERDMLRRAAMALRAWWTRECNGDVERDEQTGVCYVSHDGRRGRRARDRETGALKRIADCIARHPELGYYLQTDPRGAPLYIYPLAAVGESEIDMCYDRVGICVPI